MIDTKLRIGDILVQLQKISEAQLQHALRVQKEKNYTKKLGEIIIEEGLLSEKEFALILANQLNLEFVDLYSIDIDFSLLSNYPLNVLKNAEAMIIGEDEDFIKVSISDPLNYEAIEILEKTIVLKPIEFSVSPKSDIRHIFDRFEAIEITKSLILKVKQEIGSDEQKDDDSQSAIMQLIEQILKTSVQNRASDIHIEPNEFSISVRNRVDGVLREIFVLDIEIYNALASRIKILGDLDISERRKSQDGRFSMKLNNSSYDFRLSTAPTFHGESIVMRILDQQKVLLKLSELGMSEKNLKKFETLLKAPYGIVFVTGPTGSGKTTTLYAALNDIKDIDNKIITIEDPVEYQLPLIQQMQVNEKIGYGFSEILRSTLRQDPDILMVGEVRDEETLSIAASASLTGHLVFATLHTNDAPSAITRMIQMGLPPYLVADSLIGVVTQRLVRKVCTYCKKEHKPHVELINKIKHILPNEYKFYNGSGCSKCSFSGYNDRVVISEVLNVNDTISSHISEGKSKFDIYNEALKQGYEPMLIDGLRKALQGTTTLEEVLRVVKI